MITQPCNIMDLGQSFCLRISGIQGNKTCSYSVCSEKYFLQNRAVLLGSGGNHLALACTVVIFFIIACFKLVFLGKLS